MYVMDANNKKLFLTDIAKEKNIDDHKDVLSSLMPHDIIYADLDNVDLLIERDEFATAEFTPSGFTSIKINEDYLRVIYKKGCWSGKTMLLSVIDTTHTPYMPEVKRVMCAYAVGTEYPGPVAKEE